MSQWVINGIRTGIKTTAYPAKPEAATGVSPGLPAGGDYPANEIDSLISRCPTKVFSDSDGKSLRTFAVAFIATVALRGVEQPVGWQQTYEWGTIRDGQHEFGQPFERSIHICVVDAGDCGACLNEVKQLNNPYYNMHRLGFFITPSPRHADVLLVVGPGDGSHEICVEKSI